LVKFPAFSKVNRVRFLFPGLFTAVFLTHLVWEIFDDRPPVWDMAYHQLMGWRHLEAWLEGTLMQQFYHLSSYYPPLYYLVEATVLRVTGDTQFLPLLANFPGLLMTSLFTFLIARRLMGVVAASLAGILPLLLPLVAWTSRESLLDVSLTGLVAASVWVIIRSDLLMKAWSSVLLGLFMAAGMLVKWTFAPFMVFPVVFALLVSKDRVTTLGRFLVALLIAVPPVAAWYLPNLGLLMERFQATAAAAALEGDPSLMSPLAWIYYLRSLASYYLFLPLVLVLAAGLVHFLHWEEDEHPHFTLALTVVWLGGGLVLLTLLEAKDPRYIMPLASPLAILLVYPWREKPRWLLAIGAIAALQFLTVSFNVLGNPVRLAVWDLPEEEAYRSVRQEWVLYQTSYFGVVGPPQRENWGYAEIRAALPDPSRVGFVPDTARFHPAALELFAVRHGHDLEVLRLGGTPIADEIIRQFDYVVGKTGDQGISYITPYNEEVYRRLEEMNWPVVQSLELPDQSEARVWRNPTRSP
jgi:hypothetical protein